MILSERGAINSALADGGFSLYPAGRLLEVIRAGLPGDELCGNFDPAATAEKICRVPGPEGALARRAWERDRALLCERLKGMRAEYDIDTIFDKMMEVVPQMAKRYYGIDGFEAPRPKVVEYYFEGFNEMYKDSDWTAFNVNRAESHELSVPVGTYFKRDQVSPGMPEFVSLHEANHAMQDAAMQPEGFLHYVPWLDEGLADAFGRMMLFRATGDEEIIGKLKGFRTEVEVTDSRKVTYHYGEQTAILLLQRGRLPFVKALMRERKHDPFSIDWNAFALKIRSGWDPHIAVVSSYLGAKSDAFRKRMEREETAFRKDADFDQSDMRILAMFLATQGPACIPIDEHSAAAWIAAEAARRPSMHFVDPMAIPASDREKINGWKEDAPFPASSVPDAIWKKTPELDMKVLIRAEDVPPEFKDGVDKIASKYFVIKRKIGETVVFEPYGGGLPYRLGTGEIRCSY
ncbi:MAG: hypothetical protein V2A66_01910 [Pseudomonadota bacterium]